MPDLLTAQAYLTLNGSDASPELMKDIRRIEVDASLHMPSMATIEINDEKLGWVDSTLFDIGTKIQIHATGNTRSGSEQPAKELLFAGVVTSFEPDFPGDSQYCRMVIRAYDQLQLLHRGTGTKTFADMTDSNIAQALIGEAGLSAQVTSTSRQNQHFFRGDLTAYETLQMLARRNGYVVVADDQRVYWKPPEELGFPEVKMEYGQQLLEFRPVLTTTGQVNKVLVQGWDPKTKKAVTGTAESASYQPTEIGLGKRGSAFALANLNGAAKFHLTEGLSDQSGVQSLANAKLNAISAQDVTAEGKAFGNGKIKPGAKVDLSALGKRFNGKYLITRARHVFATGTFMTEFWIDGMSSGTFGALLAGTENARDVRGRLTSNLIIGVVTNNDDPEQLGRVKVKYPTLDESQESFWARLVAPGAGKQRGLMAVPEVNDEVIVAFADGDMNQPYILGGLWNGQDAPPSNAINKGAVDVREFTSRTGNVLRFTDDSGGGKIELMDKKGNLFMIESQAGDIAVTAKGNVNVKATGNVNVDATQNVKVTGMQVSVEAKTKLELKAPMVEIAGSGMVKISGAMVQIN